MTSLSSRTVAGRLSRRQQLQRQRAWHFWRTIWHSSLSLGILGGLVLVIRQPLWYLTAPEQIQIQGEALLTDAEIQAKLRLNFPLTLWQVEPQQVAAALLTDPPGLIRAVHLQRQMLPPSLTVWVEERPLLAQATVNGIWGAIDHQGEWISLQDYPRLRHHPGIPKLVVVGWEYVSAGQWAQFLPLLAASPVPIHEVQGTASEGVFAQTELGRVRLGSLGAELLPQQLQALAHMENLQAYCRCRREEILLIDLTSPTRPTLELTAEAMARRGAGRGLEL